MGRANVTQGKIQSAIAKGLNTHDDLFKVVGTNERNLQRYLTEMEKAGIVDHLPDGTYRNSDRVFGVDEVKKPFPKRTVKVLLSSVTGASLIATIWAFQTSMILFLLIGASFVSFLTLMAYLES
jgi:hypothetical protein